MLLASAERGGWVSARVGTQVAPVRGGAGTAAERRPVLWSLCSCRASVGPRPRPPFVRVWSSLCSLLHLWCPPRWSPDSDSCLVVSPGEHDSAPSAPCAAAGSRPFSWARASVCCVQSPFFQGSVPRTLWAQCLEIVSQPFAHFYSFYDRMVI